MASESVFQEVVELLSVGIGATVTVSVAELLLSSASNFAASQAAMLKTSQNTAVVELATASRAAQNLLDGSSASVKVSGASTAKAETEAEAMHGVPKVC